MKKQMLLPLRLLLLLVAQALYAAPNDKLVDDWITAQSTVRVWEADFKQTRQLKALTEPLVATGKLWFAAPDRFRWEVMKPAPTLAVREQDDLLVVFPKLKRAEKYSLARIRQGQWKDLMGLLDTGFPRSRADFERQFHVRDVVPIPGGQRLVIQPRSALVQKFMPELDIDISTPDLTLLATKHDVRRWIGFEERVQQSAKILRLTMLYSIRRLDRNTKSPSRFRPAPHD